MDEKTYKVSRIEGEYAYLESLAGGEDELFIAMALLPIGIDVGCVLMFKDLEFHVVS